MTAALEDRVAVVTGAGRGIGRALAIGLADAGARVACLDIDTALAEGTARLIQQSHAERGVLAHTCDMSDLGQVERALAEVEDVLGKVDVVVGNAGGPQGQTRPFLELDRVAWDEMMERNLTTAFNTGLVYGKHMDARGRGSIVLVASQLSSVVRPGLAHYAVAKAGVAHLVRAMAVELAPAVRVNGLAPGPTDTPGTSELFARPDVAETMKRLIPLGRVAQPEDMVGAAVFLASDQSRFVTGHILYVDGGYTLT